MQHLQNKVIRVIAKAKFRDSVTPLYHKLKILKISQLREYEIAKLMHQRSKAVVLKLGSTEPQGFGEAVAGVRLRSE